MYKQIGRNIDVAWGNCKLLWKDAKSEEYEQNCYTKILPIIDLMQKNYEEITSIVEETSRKISRYE